MKLRDFKLTFYVIGGLILLLLLSNWLNKHPSQTQNLGGLEQIIGSE